MNTKNEKWVAEFSAIQNCFNVTTLKDAIEANSLMVQKKTNNDFLAFGIYPTIEQAQAACCTMKKVQASGRGGV